MRGDGTCSRCRRAADTQRRHTARQARPDRTVRPSRHARHCGPRSRRHTGTSEPVDCDIAEYRVVNEAGVPPFQPRRPARRPNRKTRRVVGRGSVRPTARSLLCRELETDGRNSACCSGSDNEQGRRRARGCVRGVATIPPPDGAAVARRRSACNPTPGFVSCAPRQNGGRGSNRSSSRSARRARCRSRGPASARDAGRAAEARFRSRQNWSLARRPRARPRDGHPGVQNAQPVLVRLT